LDNKNSFESKIHHQHYGITPCSEAFKRKPSKLDEIGRQIRWGPE
jgi:hypothetical protein